MHSQLSSSREKYLLLTLAGIQFAHILDFMIMMPLGPILMEALGIDTHQFGLLVASYSFSAAVSGLLGATFVDRFERKRLLLIVFTLFGLATLACGLAPGYATLLVARGVAGAFGGVMGALIQTIVGDAIPFARRARASGIIATAFSVSTVAGVPLSLWLANHFQWRAPFIFIALLSLLIIVAGFRILPEINQHLRKEKRAHPFSAMFEVLRDTNHLKALVYSSLIIFSGFTIIPFISNGTFTAASPQNVWTLQTITGVAPADAAFARLVVITGDFLPGGPGGAPFMDDAFFEVLGVPVEEGTWGQIKSLYQ